MTEGRDFSPISLRAVKPRKRVLMAGDLRAVMAPSMVLRSNLGISGLKPFGAMR